MIHWPLAALLNTVYALLAERAVEMDRTELLLSPNVADDKRKDMGRHREELDSWLLGPMGVQAEAEKLLLKELGVDAA